MMHYFLLAYMIRTYEPIFINFGLSNCRQAKLYQRMLTVVLRRLFHVDKPAQNHASDGMRMQLQIMWTFHGSGWVLELI